MSALAVGCGDGVHSFTVTATAPAPNPSPNANPNPNPNPSPSPNPNPNPDQVTATVDLGSFGTMTSTPHTVSLVTFSALQLRLDASPAGPTGITTLRKVQCTDTYQRAKPHVTATLSTGEARDVTAQCGYSSGAPSVVSVANGALFSGATAGTATLTATFGGADAGAKGTASATLLVEEGTVEVQSMALSTPGVLHAESGSVFGSTLAVTLTDGTHYADLHALSWLDATAVVRHATDTPEP